MTRARVGNALNGTGAPSDHLLSPNEAALERIRAVNPAADPASVLPDVEPARIPRHIAIIMDGNGRWARERGLPRAAGHHAGAAAVRRLIEASGPIGLEAITLYSFSSENWKRPPAEVEALMSLYVEKLAESAGELVDQNIRFRQIGRRVGLPAAVLRQVEKVEEATASCTGPVLCLAVNYGARAEIVDAVRSLAERVRRGALDPQEIDETTVASALYTADLPDPDLLIRTAGEMRVSNYLLWQISYAELHVTPAFWPDFDASHLHAAIRDFASRRRRFGGLDQDAAVR